MALSPTARFGIKALRKLAIQSLFFIKIETNYIKIS
jgi:hypothetical protein